MKKKKFIVLVIIGIVFVGGLFSLCKYHHYTDMNKGINVNINSVAEVDVNEVKTYYKNENFLQRSYVGILCKLNYTPVKIEFTANSKKENLSTFLRVVLSSDRVRLHHVTATYNVSEAPIQLEKDAPIRFHIYAFISSKKTMQDLESTIKDTVKIQFR